MGRLLQSSGGIAAGDSPTWTGQHTFAAGTITDTKPLGITQTWNDAADTFKGLSIAITNTASAAASKLIDALVGGTSMFSVSPTGVLGLRVGSAAAPTINFGTANTGIFENGGGVSVSIGGTERLRISPGAITYHFSEDLSLYTATARVNFGAPQDTRLIRSAASVLRLDATSDTVGAALEMHEQTAPSAPSANRVRLYAVDNGAGKTQLMALFASGAAQQVAIEP